MITCPWLASCPCTRQTHPEVCKVPQELDAPLMHLIRQCASLLHCPCAVLQILRLGGAKLCHGSHDLHSAIAWQVPRLPSGRRSDAVNFLEAALGVNHLNGVDPRAARR